MAGGRPGLRLDPDFFPFAVGGGHRPKRRTSLLSSFRSARYRCVSGRRCSPGNRGPRCLFALCPRPSDSLWLIGM